VTKPTIRLASTADATAVAAIYAPFCESTPISFETVAPSTGEMGKRIETIVTHFPWLVLEDESVVAGYAYASRHRERAAYGWAVDTAVYVNSAYRRRGVGRALYTALLVLLRLQGYFKACAGITLPNPGSVGLHEAVGFKPVGVYRGIGYKQGAWHDVAWYELALQPERANPSPPLPLSEVIESSGWQDAVSLSLAHYRRGTRDVDQV
jgi:phosphinothricin acetyltransferase